MDGWDRPAIDYMQGQQDQIARLTAEVERQRRALREIVEEWAGAEVGLPGTAQEAYAIQLATWMYKLAADALRKEE